MKPIAYLVAICMIWTGAHAAQSAETDMSETFEMAATDAGFERWKRGFRTRALRRGISPDVFDRAFADVGINARTLELDGSQAEFTRTVGEYVERVVTKDRVALGKRKYRNLARVLAEIERRYGVDGRVVLAIWGVETNFGGFMGGTSVIEALATLAYDGRRRNWAERELIGALTILQSGDTRPENMEGSWAGAMGHTQFMPTSYLAYAVDFTGDGRRDIWAKDPSDGLASTANYLRVHGWRKGQPWGVEVQLPANFDYSTANIRPGRPISHWNAKGVRGLDGKPIPNYGNAGIWAPAGAGGPAFAIFPNFFVIKRYNNADTYAMAVGHLGDRIMGARGFSTKWPKGGRALTRSEKAQLQTLLTQNGFDTKGVDGKVGPNTIAAIRAYQRAQGLTPDGHPSLTLLQRLK